MLAVADPVGVSQRISLKLFSREIVFDEFQHPTYVKHGTLPVGLPEVHHRQTDRQTLF